MSRAQQRLRTAFRAIHGREERTLARELQKAIRKDVRNAGQFIENISMENTREALRQSYIRSGEAFGGMVYTRLTKNRKKANPFFSQIWINFINDRYRELNEPKIVTIKKTLIDDVKKLISNFVENNQDFFDISKAINDFVSEPNFYEWQSRRIARTETTIAMNTASETAALNSGVKYRKIWLSAGDGNERESHMLLNNQEAGQNGLFANDLRYPGDPLATDAAEVVNCRCTVIHEPYD
jgi:hypothetical protein